MSDQDREYASVMVETSLRWFEQKVCPDCGAVVYPRDKGEG